MLRIGSTHITCLYASVSVKTWGRRLFSFHLWDDPRPQWEYYVGRDGTVRPVAIHNSSQYCRPSQRLKAATENLDEIEQTRPERPRSLEAYPGPT